MIVLFYLETVASSISHPIKLQVSAISFDIHSNEIGDRIARVKSTKYRDLFIRLYHTSIFQAICTTLFEVSKTI